MFITANFSVAMNIEVFETMQSPEAGVGMINKLFGEAHFVGKMGDDVLFQAMVNASDYKVSEILNSLKAVVNLVNAKGIVLGKTFAIKNEVLSDEVNVDYYGEALDFSFVDSKYTPFDEMETVVFKREESVSVSHPDCADIPFMEVYVDSKLLAEAKQFVKANPGVGVVGITNFRYRLLDEDKKVLKGIPAWDTDETFYLEEARLEVMRDRVQFLSFIKNHDGVALAVL